MLIMTAHAESEGMVGLENTIPHDDDTTVTDLVLQILNKEYVGGVPLYHILLELILFLLLLKYAIFTPKPQKSEGDKGSGLSKDEEDELIKEWQPEPLVAKYETPTEEMPEFVSEGICGTEITVNGEKLVNFSSFNFLNFIGHQRIQDASVEAAQKYGIGSCGPRGFYGTLDCHLELERRLAKFVGAEEAVLYSYGFSTVASLIPAYSKRGDVIFYDKGVSFAIQQGMKASRSKLVGFKHNDMEDLERLLKKQEEQDKLDKAKALATRRFLVVEGLYENYGDICPLDKLVELKYKYKLRLFVEESMSLGVLGANGRGVTEHFSVDMVKVDAIAASMSNSLGSIGGFTCGRSFVMDHQRLSGLGYCYSASLPPLLAIAAITALDMIDDTKGLQETLLANSVLLRKEINDKIAKAKLASTVEVGGSYLSPIVHIRLKNMDDRVAATSLLEEVASSVRSAGSFVTLSTYLENDEMHLPAPSIRIVVSSGHTKAQLQSVADQLGQALQDALT